MATVEGIANSYANSYPAAPDDGTQVKAAHVRETAQIATSNTRYIREALLDEYSTAEEPPATTPTVTATAFQDVLSVSIPDALVGEDVEIHATGTALVAGGAKGELGIVVVEDASGAIVIVAPAGAKQRVGAATETPFSLFARHRVATAGLLNVFVQGRVTGGGSTLTLDTAIRLDARRVRRVVT